MMDVVVGTGAAAAAVAVILQRSARWCQKLCLMFSYLLFIIIIIIINIQCAMDPRKVWLGGVVVVRVCETEIKINFWISIVCKLKRSQYTLVFSLFFFFFFFFCFLRRVSLWLFSMTFHKLFHTSSYFDAHRVARHSPVRFIQLIQIVASISFTCTLRKTFCRSFIESISRKLIHRNSQEKERI